MKTFTKEGLTHHTAVPSSPDWDSLHYSGSWREQREELLVILTDETFHELVLSA